MRQQIQEGFRKAGKSLQNFDDAYSQKAYEFLLGDPEKAGFVRSMAAGTLSSPLTPGTVTPREGASNREIMFEKLLQVGSPVIGGAVRYGLPAAGVTAAGMGLAQLANSLGQQTQSTIMPQGYDQVEG